MLTESGNCILSLILWCSSIILIKDVICSDLQST